MDLTKMKVAANATIDRKFRAVFSRRRATRLRRQAFIGLVGEDGKCILQLAPPLRHHDAALQQQRAQVVDQRRALRHQSRACPMQGLDVRLRLALDRHEAHRRPRRGFRDRLRIMIVIQSVHTA